MTAGQALVICWLAGVLLALLWQYAAHSLETPAPWGEWHGTDQDGEDSP